jgi:hypothetical protein
MGRAMIGAPGLSYAPDFQTGRERRRYFQTLTGETA